MCTPILNFDPLRFANRGAREPLLERPQAQVLVRPLMRPLVQHGRG